MHLLQGRLPPAAYREAAPDPLLAGLVAAVVVGAWFGWHRSAALENLWQRGVIAVLGSVGALLLGFLAALVDRFFGVIGMGVWLAAGVWLGVAGSRWAVIGSGDPTARSGA